MGAGLQRAFMAAKRTRYPGTPAPALRQRWAALSKQYDGRDRGLVIRSFETKERQVWVKATNLDPGHYETWCYKAAVCDVWEHGKPLGRQVSIDVAKFLPTAAGYRYISLIVSEA